jgi:uncharacterized glyoxalase superfamily protein PhnB
MKLGQMTPILRMFDEKKALEFYVEFMGFRVAWRHRFSDDTPLYLEVVRDDCRIHLSEHHGDCSPGAAIRVEVTDIDAWHAELNQKQYRYARPAIEDMPWGSRELTVHDPFGNRLTFFRTMPSVADPGFKVENTS